MPEPGPQIDLHGLTVAEALADLEEYLNQAFWAELRQVRVIHGKGSGTLRRAVRDHLVHHPLVRSFRPGETGEGGAGATVVEMESWTGGPSPKAFT